jgi:hypothetical protein
MAIFLADIENSKLCMNKWPESTPFYILTSLEKHTVKFVDFGKASSVAYWELE